ncbi:two-component system, OmpR family, sensor histidine kinase KdpD [Fontibacillus panacisegetis]|uniref:histidine kinase n=1 Tax=Fontibacillus panacisegetis TaxID=670482 RepID=A0A1G7RKZ0_9BACL|nr:sensor histidine kinase KdpD [Fontibacillus panacisegetis]SDG11387.1 two-component system, OmpR family, sensor histidine kinase KdpD [Fontibacillus panacisegetis]
MAAKKPGKLKIFIGYAPGVGKTCAMLNAAHEKQKAGVNVVAGFIDPHGRPDTAALLKGLEMLPHTRNSNGENAFNEFDLDHALQRSPELILVDDLAHANTAGFRHKKRYQDVEELIRAGIDVYATVDVQQIESLADIVSTITGGNVQERIPDSVFDRADQVELVDIDPDALIDRWRSGKLYPNQETQRAYAYLFTREKLSGLRELALAKTADLLKRIAVQISGQVTSNENTVKEHILVCLSSAPSNKKVIRTAARLAEVFHGHFTALFVETTEYQQLTTKNKAGLRENLRLAEQLGAEIATVYGEDVPGQIAEYVNTSRVSKIVLGRSPNKRRGLSKSTVVDKLIALVPNVETYIIPYNESSFPRRFPLKFKPPMLSLADLAKTVSFLMVCTLVGIWFKSLGFRDENIITIYILGVLFNAMVTKGKLYSVISSIMSVLTFNYFFTEPYYSFQAYDSGYPVTFLTMLSASFIISTLTMRVREQAYQSAQKAYRTEVLLETSRKLQQAKNFSDIIEATAQQMVKLLDKTIIFYTVQQGTLSEPQMYLKNELAADTQAYTGESEHAVAEWVYRNNKRAGATTDTFSIANCLYHAVRGGDSVFAVAAIVMDQEEPLEIFEKSLMIAMLDECALALEKEQLNEKQKEISMQIQQEQLRANLLRGISHDLRTPLTSVSGNADILIGNSEVLSEEQKMRLYKDIYDDSMWLIHLVENLLSITRIENGTLNLNLQAELVEEVISEALLHVNRDSENHIIDTVLDEELLMARMDSRLIVQVLINLVDNAIKYTQCGSHIILSARRDKQMIILEISDDGPGIAEEVKARLFDMFYTANNVRGDGRRGLGLGLALCKSIVNAHGGTIGVRDHFPKGTIFYFTLQAEAVSVYE